MKYSDRIAVFLSAILLFFGCSDDRHDERLARIAGTVSDSPEEALASLDSISQEELSDADRHFHDLLTIKARDKAYITHTSDSTVLSVIDYYSSHDKDGLYPEALYYGGRVYSDMGDSPTALRYFQKALDNIPEGTPDLDLKANILSQTGRLLTNIRLFDEAIPYIEKAIKIGENNNDTINTVYDLQLLGSTYLRANKYAHAEKYLNKALAMCSDLPVQLRAKTIMYLADVKYNSGQLDSALVLIRDIPDSVNRIARNSALAYASKIYQQKELLDTAYLYAYELVHSQDSTNKAIGYHILLSPDLQKFTPLDTLCQYMSDYSGLLETSQNNNNIQQVINQQNFYNYQRHVIEKQKATADNHRLTWWIYGISSLCLILVIIVLYYKNKTNRALVELHVALENASRLNGNIDTLNHHFPPIADGHTEGTDLLEPEGTSDNNFIKTSILTSKTELNLREKLRKELLTLYHKNTAPEISNVILKSDAYKKLQELIKQKKVLSYEDPLWNELEFIVLESSPKFKENLQLLTQSRLTSIDLHTAILIKCHILPSQMSALLSRSKGAIVSRRESLCLKIFGEQLGTKVIDGIIRLL